jgi:hypothetical protein
MAPGSSSVSSTVQAKHGVFVPPEYAKYANKTAPADISGVGVPNYANTKGTKPPSIAQSKAGILSNSFNQTTVHLTVNTDPNSIVSNIKTSGGTTKVYKK